MRRWATALLAVLLLAGCSASGGADITSDWPAPVAAQSFVPAVKTCHEALEATASAKTYHPVNCKDLHVTETFWVGRAQDAPVTPGAGTAGARQAYAECVAKSTAYLGGPMRSARVSVYLVWPTRAAWTAGSRWFRCDLTESDLSSQSDLSRTGSLAGALKGRSALLLGCFNPKVAADDVSAMAAVACTTRHRAEYVGTWTAPEIAYDAQTKDRVRTATGCRSVIAKYAGVPDDADMQYRSGWISYNPTRAQWQLGERRVRCFLWFSDQSLTRSLKGAGPSALPVK